MTLDTRERLAYEQKLIEAWREATFLSFCFFVGSVGIIGGEFLKEEDLHTVTVLMIIPVVLLSGIQTLVFYRNVLKSRAAIKELI